MNAVQEAMKAQKVHLVNPVSKDHRVLTAKKVPVVKRVTKVSFSIRCVSKLLTIFKVNVVLTVHQVSPDLKVPVVKSVFVVSLVLVVMLVHLVNLVILVCLAKMVERVKPVSFSIMGSLKNRV